MRGRDPAPPQRLRTGLPGGGWHRQRGLSGLRRPEVPGPSDGRTGTFPAGRKTLPQLPRPPHPAGRPWPLRPWEKQPVFLGVSPVSIQIPLLLSTRPCWTRAHPGDLIPSHWTGSVRALSPNKVMFGGTGVGTWVSEFGGHSGTHNHPGWTVLEGAGCGSKAF